MTQAEAERRIIAELRKLLPAVPYTGADAGLAHYHALKRQQPELFAFRCAGDQWQVVHGWMLKHRLVTR